MGLSNGGLKQNGNFCRQQLLNPVLQIRLPFQVHKMARHAFKTDPKSTTLSRKPRTQTPKPYIWSGVWRSQAPLPPPNGMVLYGVGGGGAGVCGEGWGPLELQLEKRPGVTDKASIVHKPYASHKS